MIRLLPLLLLAGCATATVDCADLRQGACKVSFQRVLTETAFSMTGPDGLGVVYSSNPDQAATAEAFAAINRLAGLVGIVAGRPPAVRPLPPAPSGPPVPLVPDPVPEPVPEPQDDAVWQGRSVLRQPVPVRLSVPESCPAGPAWAMPRVTHVSN